MALTKVTYAMIKGAPVNAYDFGAVGDGITDDSDAIQTAIDYCIENDKDLVVDGLCYLASSVNIDRAVDNPTYDNYFTIYSQSGGGFIVKDDIPMFSSSLAYTAAPVSQLVRFQDLRLETDDAFLTDAFVLDKNKFLRTEFVGCSFRKIKLLNAGSAGQYVQTLYITGCNMRRWLGVFLNAQNGIFDFKFNNNIAEAGENCLNLRSPVGCAVTNNVIEGMSDTAITFDGAQSLLISGNYFEGNETRDIADASSGASGSKTVTIASNFFEPLTRTDACISWGDVSMAVSFGNYMKTPTGTLHDLSSGSFVNIVDYSEGVNADAPSYTYMRDLYNSNPLGTNYGGVIRGTSVNGAGGRLIFGLLNNDVPVEYVNIDSSGNLAPVTDNAISIGASGYRWTQVFAASGSINTSDRNEKTAERPLDYKEKAVALAIKARLKAFKFKDAVEKKGDDARIHFGIIAQDVKAAFEAEGLDATKYGVFCSDVLEDGTTRMGVRYDELFAFILGAA